MKFEIGEICEVRCSPKHGGDWKECVITGLPDIRDKRYRIDIPNYRAANARDGWGASEENLRKKKYDGNEACGESWEDIKKGLNPLTEEERCTLTNSISSGK